MNLGEIESEIYDTLGYQRTPDGSVTNRVRRHINNIHRQVLGMRGTTKLRRKTLPFTCTANDPSCVLPQAAIHIAVIVDRANQRPLHEVSIQDMRGRDPGNIFIGAIPDSYSVINYAAAVAHEPSTPSQLYLVSDSTDDAGGISASVEGTITGGYQRRSTVVLNGTTAVALDGNLTWSTVTKFYLSATSKGNVTLLQSSGAGTELARISEGHSFARYTQINLQGIPASALTYYADVELRVETMVTLTDEPLIPEDFDYVLVAGTLMREYVKREKPILWNIENGRYRQGISDMKAWLARRGDMPAKTRSGFSQLGAFFPADT